MTARFVIRPVDGGEDAVNDALSEMHDTIFGDTAPIPRFEIGAWWIVSDGRKPVGFAGITASAYLPNTGYLKRAGVLEEARGRNLQRRLIAVRERYARRHGWETIYTDTATFNVKSSNNLFRAGYELFRPDPIWNGEDFLYWRKRCA